MHVAAIEEQPEVAKLLLDAHASVDVRENIKSMTPLELAVKLESTAVAGLLSAVEAAAAPESAAEAAESGEEAAAAVEIG